ncbi:LysM domain-containing protein [Geodermatophilus obscurus]|uniref:LysM domain-containing protein n=1 Tax=Geodermatophilus obscurus TaxID=1861 RepID=A0A1M7UCI9_9ACTN|nr:LysM peptidoglycan-binding domain-containing protein [Geodermatophilus obscurus]SHN80772.1 LysM domain-containing protein [Geodermatophilus obscurus]
MANVRQAVLEFDAAVRVPWRPLLEPGAVGGAPGSGSATAGPARAAGPAARSVLPGAGPRVAGHLRPVPDCPAAPGPRGAGPDTAAPRTRRDPARPGGRPLRSAPAGGAVRGGWAPVPVSVRPTRRGRRFAAALALGAAVALGASIAPLVDGVDGGLRLAGESSVVVQPGDTVWSIAGEVAGGGQDVRVVVDAIEELNDLEGSVVVPGQVLELP